MRRRLTQRRSAGGTGILCQQGAWAARRLTASRPGLRMLLLSRYYNKLCQSFAS